MSGPADSRAASSAEQNESAERATASLLRDEAVSPHEKKILKLIRPDESIRIGQPVEMLEAAMSSSEICAALFELELEGKTRPLPGKGVVESFE